MDFQVAADLFMTALCMYREDRSGASAGMVAVGCVLRNRVARDKSTFYAEVVKRLQFSSITAPGDPELSLYPVTTDPSWVLAGKCALLVIDNEIADTTGGATLYYAESIAFPKSWDRSKVRQTVSVGGQLFFEEI